MTCSAAMRRTGLSARRRSDLAIDGQMFAFRLARDGDGIRDIRKRGRQAMACFGWRSPREDLRCFRFLELKSPHELQGFERSALELNGDMPASSCSRTAKGPKECAHAHAGIEFLARAPNPQGMTGLVADFWRRHADRRKVSGHRETRVGHQSLCRCRDQQ